MNTTAAICLLALASLAAFRPSDPPSRCECIVPSLAPTETRLGKALDSSDVVFSGQAIAARLLTPDDLGTSYPAAVDRVQYTFLVDAVWKGEVSDTISVRSGMGAWGGDCARGFHMGWEYLVYGRSVEEEENSISYYSTSSCDRTAWVLSPQAIQDLEVLERDN